MLYPSGTDRRGHLMKRTHGVVLSLMASLSLFSFGTGCSGVRAVDGNPSDRSADGLAAAFFQSYAARVRDDGPGDYAFLDASCQAKWTVDAWSKEVAKLAAADGKFGSVDAGDTKVVDVRTQNMTGDSGEVTGRVAGPDGAYLADGNSAWFKWIYQDGRWRKTYCDASS